MRSLLLGAVLLSASGSSPLQAQTVDTSLVWVRGGPFRLRTVVFRAPGDSAQHTLVVVLHGDSPFGNPGYQDAFASQVAARRSSVVAAAILRPGYTDPEGRTSEGERGETTGDNYNAGNTDAMAQAVEELARRYGAKRTVLVGHSGGAAIAANILGTHPGLVDGALLVSCPCDVDRWRAHMFRKTGFEGFRGAITTLSPLALVGRISPRARVVMLVGGGDDVAPPSLSRTYRDAAVRQGKQVSLELVAGEGHDMLMNPAVFAALDSFGDARTKGRHR